jgi:hypothetical protein
MPQSTRSSARPQLALAVSDKPVPPNPVDDEIARNHGTSVALEATTERLQGSKKVPSPTPAERIHELTEENGQLRLEVRYHQQMQDAMRALQEDAKFVAEKLERAVVAFNRVQKAVEDDWYQAIEGVQAVHTRHEG